MAQAAKRARDDGVRKAAESALKESGRSAQDFSDDVHGQADLKAALKTGNLSLEDLKSRVTPDILKKAGITEQDWQQFLKDARAYQESLSRQQGSIGPNDSLNKLGDPNRLPNTSPGLVEPPANAGAASLPNTRGQPPPGFREPYRPWTSRPQPKE